MTFSKYALEHGAKCPTLRVCRKTEGGCGTTYSSLIWGNKKKCNGCGHELKWGFYDEDEYEFNKNNQRGKIYPHKSCNIHNQEDHKA